MPTIHQAKTNLSRLIEKAERGEEVVISRGKEPVVRLVLVSKHSGKRQLGILKGKYKKHNLLGQPRRPLNRSIPKYLSAQLRLGRLLPRYVWASFQEPWVWLRRSRPWSGDWVLPSCLSVSTTLSGPVSYPALTKTPSTDY